MTVQELFIKIDLDDFVRAYLASDSAYVDQCVYCNMFEPDTINFHIIAERRICDAVRLFRSKQANPHPENVVFAVKTSDGLFDTFAVKRDDLAGFDGDHARLPESYAFDLEKIEDVLGYEVSEAALQTEGLMNMAIAILYEISFFGYVMDERDKEAEKVKASLDLIVEKIKDGKCETFSLEGTDLFSDIPVHAKSPEEEAFDRELVSLEREYWRKRLALMYIREKYLFSLHK